MSIHFDSIFQRVCPAPRRFLQRLILDLGLKTGLDVGCGASSPLTALRRFGFRSAGLDISKISVEEAKKRDLHDEYIEGDIRKVCLEQQYDVITCCHMIEHLSREDGESLLRHLERVAKHLVYIETPNGFLEQISDDVEPQRHLSGWLPHDFGGRGYSVFGSGLRGARGSYGAPRVISEPVTRALDRASQWIVFRRPFLASSLAAIRFTDFHGNIRKV